MDPREKGSPSGLAKDMEIDDMEMVARNELILGVCSFLISVILLYLVIRVSREVRHYSDQTIIQEQLSEIEASISGLKARINGISNALEPEASKEEVRERDLDVEPFLKALDRFLHSPKYPQYNKSNNIHRDRGRLIGSAKLDAANKREAMERIALSVIQTSDQAFPEGVPQKLEALEFDLLNRIGLKLIHPREKDEFDPMFHEKDGSKPGYPRLAGKIAKVNNRGLKRQNSTILENGKAHVDAYTS